MLNEHEIAHDERLDEKSERQVYRLLGQGESLAEGDEWPDHLGEWVPVGFSQIGLRLDNPHGIVRRKLA